MHGLGRAVFGAGSAVGVFRFDDATVNGKFGDTDLCGYFFLYAVQADGVVGANVGTDGTFVVAIAVGVRHVGFEEVSPAELQAGGAQDVAGALDNADVAGGAFRLEALQALRAGRG
ncbi:hypothetical protein Barb7_00319 [Bacteroidales bacterium Barb7]|nr:hypothetical protein Barb7_00319 [Bacteroidales bacterium Barb7]